MVAPWRPATRVWRSRPRTELGRLSLADALAVVLVLRGDDAACFERAVVRWHSLAAQHTRARCRLMLAVCRRCADWRPRRPDGLLAELCALYGLRAGGQGARRWLERAAGG